MKRILLLSSSVALATLLFTGCGIKTTEYNGHKPTNGFFSLCSL